MLEWFVLGLILVNKLRLQRHQIVKISLNILPFSGVTLLIIHSGATPWNKWTLLSRAETAKHGHATWLIANPHTCTGVCLYARRRRGALSASSQRCYRLATDKRAAVAITTRPPSAETLCLHGHGECSPSGRPAERIAWQVQGVGGAGGREHLLQMYSTLQRAINRILSQCLVWILYLVYVFQTLED
jgi:hypothetical protein